MVKNVYIGKVLKVAEFEDRQWLNDVLSNDNTRVIRYIPLYIIADDNKIEGVW